MADAIGDFSQQTRKVYHEQHERIANDKRAMERFLGMFTTEYFGLGDDYFKGKKVLDAGCGNTGKMLIRLHDFGAAEIYGIDLDEEFIPSVQRTLTQYNVPLEKVRLSGGSILDMPYEDGSFDFVGCHGVLMHLNNMEEVGVAFKELARVTKPGGYLYTVYEEESGLFKECLVPALREYYEKNAAFRKLIDELKPEDFAQELDFMVAGMLKYTGEKADLSAIKDLLDMDLCVTIQNLLQAPVRLNIPEDYIRKIHQEYHFTGLRNLRRYVKRKNFRKYFAPLHFEIQHPMSKILYGPGHLEFIAQKKK